MKPTRTKGRPQTTLSLLLSLLLTLSLVPSAAIAWSARRSRRGED